MDIEKKIRKLLALSESPNEFEAQAALLTMLSKKSPTSKVGDELRPS